MCRLENRQVFVQQIYAAVLPEAGAEKGIKHLRIEIDHDRPFLQVLIGAAGSAAYRDQREVLCRRIEIPMEFVDFMSRGDADLIDRVADFLIKIGLQDWDRSGIERDGVGDYGTDESIVIDIEK